MNMIARLTRAQLEALAFGGLLALLSAISSLLNVGAGGRSLRRAPILTLGTGRLWPRWFQ